MYLCHTSMDIIHDFKVTGKNTILHKSEENNKNTSFKYYRNFWQLLIQRTKYMSSLHAHVVLHHFMNLKISGGIRNLEACLFPVTK